MEEVDGWIHLSENQKKKKKKEPGKSIESHNDTVLKTDYSQIGAWSEARVQLIFIGRIKKRKVNPLQFNSTMIQNSLHSGFFIYKILDLTDLYLFYLNTKYSFLL